MAVSYFLPPSVWQIHFHIFSGHCMPGGERERVRTVKMSVNHTQRHSVKVIKANANTISRSVDVRRCDFPGRMFTRKLRDGNGVESAEEKNAKWWHLKVHFNYISIVRENYTLNRAVAARTTRLKKKTVHKRDNM